MRTVAIPCLYYLTTTDDDIGAEVDAELLRVAWDSGAPPPAIAELKPDMAGRLFTLGAAPVDPDVPEYRVVVTVLAREDLERAPGADGPATDIDTLLALRDHVGEQRITTPARNRYEAEQHAVQQVLRALAAAGVAERCAVIVQSVRMK